MVIAFISGAGLLVLWIILAFVVAVPAGWVHLLLAGGTVMIARGIVLSPPAAGKEPDTGGPGQTGAGKR